MFKEIMVKMVAPMLEGKSDMSGNELVRDVSIDSREIRPGSLFFALPGSRTDGHEHTRDAIDRGACAVVVDHATGCGREIIVRDTLHALGTFAKKYREIFSGRRTRIIAVTGTNGKTTVKDAIAAILMRGRSVLTSRKNYNSLIGLPLTLFDLHPQHEYVVLEMGTSHPGEIARLCEIAKPDIGVVTRIGPGHLKDLGTLQGIRKEKLALIRSLPAHGTGFVGEGTGDVRGSNIIQIDSSMVFNVEITEQETSFTYEGHDFTTPLLGAANVYNCLIALCVTQYIGVDHDTQYDVLQKLKPQPGRVMPIVRDGVLIIDDTYNANPLSMKAAIDFACQIDRPRIFIFGDMLELGTHAKRLHEEIGIIAQKHSDVLLTCGPLARYYGGVNFTDKTTLVRHVVKSLSGDELILVKASRGRHFEDIITMILEEL